MKKIVVGLSLTLAFFAIIALFWYQEMKYLLPTPIPKDYTVVMPDEVIKFDSSSLISYHYSKPRLLHFFSPECPCSRFNLAHFRSLLNTYGESIEFFVVVESPDDVPAAKKMIDKNVTIIVDRNKRLANACGVYSTPQAALIEAGNKLYFRGNFNRSRYCTDKKSNFVQMAIDSLIAKKSPPVFSELATVSYGCSLRENSKLLVTE